MLLIIFALQVFGQFIDKKNDISLHLIETSPKLSAMQLDRLADKSKKEPVIRGFENVHTDSPWYQHCTTKFGHDVYWYRTLDEVPKQKSIFIANEFFDALPVLVFHVRSRNSAPYNQSIQYCDLFTSRKPIADGARCSLT